MTTMTWVAIAEIEECVLVARTGAQVANMHGCRRRVTNNADGRTDKSNTEACLHGMRRQDRDGPCRSPLG